MDHCRAKLELPTNRKIVLNVGNLYHKVKGHKYLIEAMSEVIKHRKDVLCIIIGSGKLYPELKKQIESLGLNNYIKLIGGKPSYEIPIWMNACDVFVLPSLRESFGIVQIEAMACGKPVVATRNGGSEEIIVSKDYGLICDPARPKELANNILLSLDKSWDSEKIVSYVSQFSLSVIGNRILDIYDSALSN